MNKEEIIIGVIGLGYVGLPLAVEFGKGIETIGFDINEGRIKELEDSHDRTLEVDEDDLKKAAKLACPLPVKLCSKPGCLCSIPGLPLHASLYRQHTPDPGV